MDNERPSQQSSKTKNSLLLSRSSSLKELWHMSESSAPSTMYKSLSSKELSIKPQYPSHKYIFSDPSTCEGICISVSTLQLDQIKYEDKTKRENVVIETDDSKPKQLVSKKEGYNPAKFVAKSKKNRDCLEVKDTDLANMNMDNNRIQMTCKDEKKLTPLKIRMQRYWKTHDTIMDSENLEYRMQITLAEFATFLIFVIILTLTFYLDIYPSNYKYHFTNSVRRAFITSDFINLLKIQMNFYQIKSAGDIWGYLTKKLIQTLHPTYYYNFDDVRVKRLNFYDNNPLFENGLIGTTRIRMKRVKNDSCIVHKAFRRSFKRTCYSYFSTSAENKRPLGTDFVWDYQEGSSSETGTWGEFGYYTAGGYSELLSWKNERDSRTILYSMKNNHWLTRATRVLIVDFLLFNPTINYFCKVRMTFELPPEGGVNPLVSIDTVKLIFPIGKRDYVVVGVFFVLLCFGVYYLLEELKRMGHFNIQYCLYPKRILDLVICLLTLWIVFYILFKTFYLRQYITRTIRQSTIERRYFNFDKIIRFEKLYMKFAGLLLFFCFLKISTFLNLTRCMTVINVTIKRSMKHFLGYLLYFGLVLSAFAFVGHILFGTKSKYFRTWLISFFSLVNIILGDFNYLEFHESDKIIGPLFFAIFLFIICFHLVFIFLAIVQETYSETKSEQERLGVQHELPFDEYLKSGFSELLPWFRLEKLSKHPNIEECEDKCAQDTYLRLRNALLKHNFTLTEVNKFFTKYGIKGENCINCRNIQRIIEDLDKKGFTATEAPTREDIMASNKWQTELEPDEILVPPRNQGLTLNFKDFKDIMCRMRNIEKKITKTSRRVAGITELMNYYNRCFWSVPMHCKKSDAIAWYRSRTMKKKVSILEKIEKTFGKRSENS